MVSAVTGRKIASVLHPSKIEKHMKCYAFFDKKTKRLEFKRWFIWGKFLVCFAAITDINREKPIFWFLPQSGHSSLNASGFCLADSFN